MNLRQLSEVLGLSQTTVSRALNGYPEVSEKTRVRVREAAERHNYRPSLRATSLATGRTMMIGHVIPLSAREEMVNIIFTDFLAGAGEIYAQNGYAMRLSVVSDADEVEIYEDMKANGVVDGVLLHAPSENDQRIPLLDSLKLPFLVHGRATGTETPYSWLDVNNRRAIQRATEHLLELGHRRIALLNGLESYDFAIRRRSGYLGALEAAWIAADTSLMRSNEMTEPFGYKAGGEMLDQPNPPTAFIASSFVMALGVRRAIEERGLIMGRDVSVVCFDDDISYLPNGSDKPIFTALKSSVRAAGRRCAELLIAKINDEMPEEQHEQWEAELVIGPSTGPAPSES
ncbi:LacI family DNA-binding transcriptional regulator [Litoreibacter roseus]|uniref:LacI family transcriptional regulator n=1 Tax=Litoreibacter roseus TaxID=2601869 RepID=A0A6N6JDL2_9RHOB|nr:substrate-binding domain-containing protein [Litoreibacter roseus]GFE64245.1 LacI family transcriptional regulator [Litoreibacter roseus]